MEVYLRGDARDKRLLFRVQNYVVGRDFSDTQPNISLVSNHETLK